MSDRKLDEILAELKAKRPSEEMERDAARRVFRNVFDAAYLPERAAHVGRITGCADFQALIPVYLDGQLPAARVSLLEDHISECVHCRRALQEARAGQRDQQSPAIVRFARPVKKRRRLLPWAVAATLAAGLALGITGALNGLLPGQRAVRVQLETVQGTLYRVSDLGLSLVTASTVIRAGDELRTAKGSRAVFRLVDGAKLEMGERSDISIARGGKGTSVQVERGHIIVNALYGGPKSFSVSAGDIQIPVRNAVFAINRGVKGSRVAVAKGLARCQAQGKTFDVRAGQVRGPDYRLVNASLTSDFAWSGDSAYYLGLLKELSTLHQQLQAIPSPQLPSTSGLAKYLPENTVLYAAIPNVGGTIDEAKRIFEQRLAESEVLRDWWQQQPAARNGQLDQALTQISSISQYLGNEIVMAVGLAGPHRYTAPVFLAEQRQSGLREYLEQNVPASAGLHILTGSAPASQAGKGLFLSLDNGVVLASPDSAELSSVLAAVTNPSADHFPQTAFYKRIEQSYSAGSGYLLAIDMEQMVTKSVLSAKEVPPGFNNAQYLVLEKRTGTGDTETRASLSFSGAREGIASWLGAPGPMGSLDFVSPDANFAAAVVMKNPLSIVQEMIGYISQSASRNRQPSQVLQNDLGVTFAKDVAATLGGDATFAVDGPLLPVPSWKLIVEVYNPDSLQNAIAGMVERFNQTATPQTGKLVLASQVVESRTFYSLQNDKNPNFTACYTFVDGYLVAGPSAANLVQAIKNRSAGYTLTGSSEFRSQLPADGYANFSAILYHNAGKSLGSAAGQLQGSGALSLDQKRALAALAIGSGPGLIGVYGEPDRIVAASKGGFLGFNLATLAGLGHGAPMLPLITSGARSSIPAPAGAGQTRF